MKNLLLSLPIICALLITGCSRQAPPSRSVTTTFTAANETELRDGAQRINQLKQELLDRGFRVVSTAGSETKEQVKLKGDYGALKDAEVTLWVGKQLEMKEPHLGAGLQASLPNQGAEQEFERFSARLKSVVLGK